MRGEKSQLFMKEAKEEAMHFGWGKTDLELNVCFFKEKHWESVQIVVIVLANIAQMLFFIYLDI